MRKRSVFLLIACISLLLLAVSCHSTPTNPDDVTSMDVTAESTDSSALPDESVTPDETETEPETESPYLIPDPTRIDLTTFTADLLNTTFRRGTGA
jgi:hypothetical protein